MQLKRFSRVNQIKCAQKFPTILIHIRRVGCLEMSDTTKNNFLSTHVKMKSNGKRIGKLIEFEHFFDMHACLNLFF